MERGGERVHRIDALGNIFRSVGRGGERGYLKKSRIAHPSSTGFEARSYIDT